jgi:renalase
VTALRSIGDGYEAVLADGGALRADHVLLTPPVPQTLALLAAGEIDLAAEQRACLERIRYDPCIALLVLLPEPSHVPAPGGLKPDSDVIAWVADNAQKGISPTVPAVTIHATAEFSRRHWDTDAAAVQRMLLEAAAPWLGSPPTTVQVHRWLYSQPHDGPGRPFLLLREAPSLLVVGDAFGPGAIEGAALSGLEAGAWLAARLGRA